MTPAERDAWLDVIIARWRVDIVAMALEGFRDYGRGNVLLAVLPDEPALDDTAPGVTVAYVPLARSVATIGELPDLWRPEGERLIQLCQTYDPATEAVLMIGFETAAPVTRTIALDGPVMTAGPERAQ